MFESFWISLTDDSGTQVRCGINPYNTDRCVRIFSDGGQEELDSPVGGCNVSEDSDGYVTAWDCNFQLPFLWLGALGGPVNMQMIHAHSTEAADVGDVPFYTALCPGMPEASDGGFDWIGCQVDPRSLVIYN